MSKPRPDIREIFEEKARQGDGAFAIAYALMDLSDSQEATAKALGRLGNGNAATHMGAIEGVGLQLTAAAKILGEAVESVGSTLGEAIEAIQPQP